MNCSTQSNIEVDSTLVANDDHQPKKESSQQPPLQKLVSKPHVKIQKLTRHNSDFNHKVLSLKNVKMNHRLSIIK